jgi:hypothetical protein
MKAAPEPTGSRLILRAASSKYFARVSERIVRIAIL